MKLEFLVIIFLTLITIFLLGAVWGQKRYIKKFAKFLDELMDEYEKEKK